MNKAEKWDRGRTLLLESLYKPDSKLRGCAYNQGCYDERPDGIHHLSISVNLSLSKAHLLGPFSQAPFDTNIDNQIDIVDL